MDNETFPRNTPVDWHNDPHTHDEVYQWVEKERREFRRQLERMAF